MSRVLSLALKITGDASGVRLTPVERALQRLGQETEKTGKIFDKFAKDSELGVRAQQAFSAEAARLTQSLRDGNITSQQFADSFAKLAQSAKDQAAALEEGRRLTEQYRTEEEKRSIAIERLNDLLQKGGIEQETYARALADANGTNAEATRLAAEAAREQAAILEEGRRITEQYRTAEEDRAIALDRLNKLLEKGGIDQETYNRAVADASGANQEAARAAAEAAQQQAEAAKVQADALRQRQALESRAAQIINANLTAQERYEIALAEINELNRQGLFTQEQYNRAVAAAKKPLDDAAAAAERAAEAGKESSLRFNELSGIFAVLPGPLGNIAGRISGISSASEGLSRIFAGGLRSGITNVASSFTALVNPVTASLAGLAAFGAGATAVARGLVSLEDRVERLSRLSTQLGVSFEFVQVLEEAGRRADVSIEQLSGSFARLQNTLAGADEESKKAQAALQRLGVSVQDFGALSEEQRIDLIGERLAQIEDPAQRSAAAIALFGRSGVQLLPFFNELGLAAADIERVGGALSDLDRTRLANFGGAIDVVSRAVTRLGELVLLPFAGLATDVGNALGDLIGFVNRVVGVIGVGLTPIIDALGASFKILSFLLQQINRSIDFVFGTAKASADAAKKATADARKELEKPLDRGLAIDLQRTFATVNESIDSTIGLVDRFGSQAEFATDRFRVELTRLEATFDRSTANGLRAYTKAVADATENYREQINAIRAAQQERDRLLESERQVADTLLEQLRIQREFGGDNQRAQAANNVLVIEREIARAQAFGPGNEAAKERIRLLQEALAVQQGIADGTTQQVNADRTRIEALSQQAERQSEVEKNILAIKREQERVQVAIGEAAFGDSDEVFRAAQRQEEQLQSLLAEQEALLQAQGQGFGEGFDVAFAGVDERIEGLVAKASELGTAGVASAKQLQEGIERAQQAARGGFFTREEFVTEENRLTELFNKQQSDIQSLAAERQRVNQFVDQQLELARFGGDSARLQASKNAAAIEAEIARVTAEVNAARAAGEQQAVQAGIERLAQLDQAAAKERDIANGKAAEREAQRRAFEEQAKLAQQQQQQAQQQQAQLAQEQQRIFQEQAAASAAEAERQATRIRSLNSIGQQSVAGADLRSTEGASQFISAAAGAFDPNLAQQRAQTKLLQKIVENSGALRFLEQGIGQSVRILGGVP